MFYLFKRGEDSGQENNDIIVVRAGPDDVIFVPYEYLPLKVNRETRTDPFGEFHNVETEDDRREIYVLIHINNLYEKFGQSILEHSKYDGWEEGWAWNINTLNFENRQRPSGQTHCWVHHTQSWESTCTECFKPDCPSVGIPLSNLEKLYCECEKCDECGLIDDECECQASRQEHSVYSSDSCFVRCEHCHLRYDSSNQRQHYYHFLERCC